MVALPGAFGGFAPAPLDWDDLASRSAADGTTYLSCWTAAARAAKLSSPAADVVDAISELAAGKKRLEPTIQRVLQHFSDSDPDDDLKDDLSTWRRLAREIKALGSASLDRFLQELELRSKEPVPEPGAVLLTTIHGAKGLEFDTVYLIGMAEEILPSQHSVKKGSGSAKLEEERPKLLCRHDPSQAAPDPLQGGALQGVGQATVSIS